MSSPSLQLSANRSVHGSLQCWTLTPWAHWIDTSMRTCTGTGTRADLRDKGGGAGGCECDPAVCVSCLQSSGAAATKPETCDRCAY